MKPTLNRFQRLARTLPLFSAVIIAFSASRATATAYFWDNNGVTAGFGTGGGTWGTSQNWTTDNTGIATPGVTTSLSSDDLNFGYYTTGLAAGTVTLSGALDAQRLTFASGSGAIVLSGASSTLTLGGTGIIAVNNANGATIGNNTSAVLDGTGGLTKLGTGTLTLSGTAVNPLYGGLSLNSGTLALDFSNFTAGYTDIINNGNALTLAGGALTIKGENSAVNTSQTFDGTTVSAGGGSILVNPNGAGASNGTTVNLGSLTTNAAGGSLLIGKAASAGTGTLAITTTTASDAQGIYGGRTVWFNGTANTGYDWATSTGPVLGIYTLAANSSYNTTLPTIVGDGTANYKQTANNSALTGDIAGNSWKVEAPAASQSLALGAYKLTLTSGGLLSTGTNAFSISGNTGVTGLTAGNGSGAYDLVVSQYSSGILTISAVVGDNGGNAVSVTKAGSGQLNLSGVNTHTGGTYLNSGTLYLGHNKAIGTGTLTINGGILSGIANLGALGNNNNIVVNNDFQTYALNTWNTGTGTFKISKPVIWTVNSQGGGSNLTVPSTTTITDANGNNTLNALDITYTYPTTSTSLTLAAPISLHGNQTLGVLNIGVTSSLTISGNIGQDAAGYGLTIAGSTYFNGQWTGQLTFSGTNTYTGPTTINSGVTLQLGAGGAVGSFSSSGTIVTNGRIVFNRNNAILQGTDFGTISGTGEVAAKGGTLTLSSANTFSGPVGSYGGTLSFNSIANAGVSSPIGAYATAGAGGILIGDGSNAGGTLKYTGTTASSDRGFTLANSGTLDVNTASTALTMGASTLGGYTLTVNGGAGSSLTLGAVTLTGGATLTSNVNLTVPSVTATNQNLTLGGSATDSSVTGAIATGAGSVTKTGAGTWTLSGTNTFGGALSVQEGKLSIGTINDAGGNGVLGNSANAVTLGSNTKTGTLQYTGGTASSTKKFTLATGGTGAFQIDSAGTTLTLSGLIGGSGNLTKTGAGTLILTGANTFTGTVATTGGTLLMGDVGALQNGVYTTSTGGLDVGSYTTLTLGGLGGSVSPLATTITGYSGITALTLNPQGGVSASYSGVIANGSGNMTLTKTGLGTQILSGVNTYTGATSVTGGLLRIDSLGSLDALSAVGVSAGAIGGTGTINGLVTLSGTGGIDLRSAAAGTLTLGSLAITGASGANTLSFDLGTTSTDKIVVNGAVSLTNPVAVRLYQISGPGTRLTAGTYDLLTAGSGTLPAASNFVLPTTKAYGQTFSLALDGGATKLQLASTQAVAGPAAAFWVGADATWSNAANWNSSVAGGVAASGAPSYQSNVSFYTTTPAAGNLTNTLDADFDINSLNFLTTATSPVTINGTKMLTIEATNANGNTASSGIVVGTPTSGTVTHTINANIGLPASQTWTVNTSATLTVGGNVTDLSGNSYTLTKAGAGTLNLNGTTIIGGNLQGSGSGAGKVVVGSGGSLSVGSGPGNNLYMANNGGNGFILDASAGSNFTANVNNFGVGLGGTDNNTGFAYLATTNTITAWNAVQVGTTGTNEKGTLTTAANGATTINTPYMLVGGAGALDFGAFALGANSSLTVQGTNAGRTQWILGQCTGAGSSGSWGAWGYGNLSAGTASLKLSSLAVGQMTSFGTGNGAYIGLGVLVLSSNAANHLDISGPGNAVSIGYAAGGNQNANGTVTIGNLDATSSVTSTDNSTAILLAYKGGTGTSTGTLNLNGGTLAITTSGAAIAGGGGTSTLNLNGITLKAGASSSTFISGLTNTYVRGGGVTIDTGANAVAVPQALVKAPSTSATVNYGLAITTLASTAGGSGYSMTSPPTVTFNTPTGGTAATGFAVVNPAGQVTGIVVTSPGSGYASGATATITLSGSGGATFTNPTATVDQSVGGLTKTGANTLTLSGVNTYTGDTTVSNGSLVLDDNAGLTFVVTNSGSNKVTGAGSATLEGDFTITTAAVTVGTGTWTLVDTTSKSFAASFTVTGAGWSETSNVWTKVDGLNTWRFYESNGTLTLNVEPGGYNSWASDFTSPALSNTAADADPDGDGLANSLEYVFGTDPRYSNPGGPQAEAAGGDFVLTFSRDDDSETDDIALVVEISTDLSDWTTLPSYSIGTDTAGSSAGVTVAENGSAADTITVTVAKDSNVKMFGRLRAVVSE